MADTHKNKKVLIINYFFPPEVGGGGVMRTVKFVKYLRGCGWEPIVLTAKRYDTYVPDPSLLDGIEDVKVYRCEDLFRNPFKYLLSKLKAIKGRAKSHPVETVVMPEKGGSFFESIKKFFIDVLFIPDETFGWIIPAVWRGRDIIKKERVDVVLTTSPPVSDHFIGLVMKKWMGVPLLIDYRDRWAGHPTNDGNYFWRKKINRFFEKMVAQNSDYIITTTKGQSIHFQDEYAQKRVKVIWNGYDENDFSFKPADYEGNDKLILSHFGRLTRGRSVKSLVQGLASVNKEILEDIEIHFYGTLSSENEALINQSNVAANVKIFGHVSHNEALERMYGCSVLIIIQYLEEDGFNAVPAKIFEYFRTERTVFALCPEGSEVWSLVKDNNLGTVADTRNVRQITESIESLYVKWKKGSLISKTPQMILDKFSRKSQAKELADVLDVILLSG